MKSWFETQRHYTFYRSSILFVYDASNFSETSNLLSPNHCQNDAHRLLNIDNNVMNKANGYNKHIRDDNVRKICNEKGKQMPFLADAKLIDFAHIWPSTERDENFLDSLNKLLKFLESYAEKLSMNVLKHEATN